MHELIVCGFVFSILALSMSIICLVEIKAMQKSTHKVQFYNPNSQEFSGPITDKQAEGFRKEVFDNV